MIALTALGNRTWGSDSGTHWGGALLMTMGLWIGNFTPLWSLPLIFIGVILWRVWTSRPWLHMETPALASWIIAIERSSTVMPLALLSVYLHHMAWWPFIIGIGAIFLIPAIYFFTGKQSKVDPTELAEFLSGAVIGCIFL